MRERVIYSSEQDILTAYSQIEKTLRQEDRRVKRAHPFFTMLSTFQDQYLLNTPAPEYIEMLPCFCKQHPESIFVEPALKFVELEFLDDRGLTAGTITRLFHELDFVIPVKFKSTMQSVNEDNNEEILRREQIDTNFVLKVRAMDIGKVDQFLEIQLQYFLNHPQGKTISDFLKYLSYLFSEKEDPVDNWAIEWIEMKFKESAAVQLKELPVIEDWSSSENRIVLPVIPYEYAILIYEKLKDYFSENQQPSLLLLLQSGKEPEKLLWFRENGNKLVDAFRKWYDNDYIISCNKSDLRRWIIRNFVYGLKKAPVGFKDSYVIDILSSNKPTVCKNPIVNLSSTTKNI